MPVPCCKRVDESSCETSRRQPCGVEEGLQLAPMSTANRLGPKSQYMNRADYCRVRDVGDMV
jgi:hypothetical protein